MSLLWLFTQCFRAHSPNAAERVASAQNPPIAKLKAELPTSIVALLCAEERERRPNRMLGHFQGEFFLMSAEQPRHWVEKIEKTGPLSNRPFERKSSKGRQSRSTGYPRDFGSIVVGTKPSGRTVDSNKQINYKYIATDEKPSHHITVGLAWAPLIKLESVESCALNRFMAVR